MHPAALESPIDARALSKLRWRCRRGLLENDLFIERFFALYAQTLNQRQADALSTLMDLSDNDLLDLLLGRKSQIPGLEMDSDCREVLVLLRNTH